MMCEKVGIIIRELRAVQGQTKRELAERTGINPKTIWGIEHGKWDSVRLYTFEILLHALGYEIVLRKTEEPCPKRSNKDIKSEEE